MRPLRAALAASMAGVLLLGACTSDDSGGDDGADETPSTTATVGGSAGSPTTAPVPPATGGGGKLAAIQAAGTIKCGVRDDLPGFNSLNPAGDHVGFDSDFCRVIAAAIFGDATKVTFVDVETADRFTTLQSGAIDVLVRNTTWTATRDGSNAATFLQPTFYDGQGMMVATDSGIESLEDLAGQVVCVAGTTTTEGNVTTEFARLGLQAPEVLPFTDVNLLQQAFQEGRCDGWSSDISQLTGLRSAYPGGPDTLTILEGAFSKEPLAPAVLDGESALAQAVQWAVYATIQAEEFDLTSANVDQQRTAATNTAIKQFLGVAVDGATTDPGLGLPVDFNYQVVKQVGNYAEIFEANLTPLGLERGQNALWTDGGLLYAPPYR